MYFFQILLNFISNLSFHKNYNSNNINKLNFTRMMVKWL